MNEFTNFVAIKSHLIIVEWSNQNGKLKAYGKNQKCQRHIWKSSKCAVKILILPSHIRIFFLLFYVCLKWKNVRIDTGVNEREIEIFIVGWRNLAISLSRSKCQEIINLWSYLSPYFRCIKPPWTLTSYLIRY